MRKAATLLAMTLLMSTVTIAQYQSQYPGQAQQPTAPQEPVNPTYPSSQMPPDTAAPPANAAPAPQNPPVLSGRQPAATYSAAEQVANGTEIRAMLDTPLSTKTSHVGDRFTATVAQPVRGTNGAVAIPAGSKIHGEVIQAEEGKTLPAVRGKGKLNLRFTTVALPDGSGVPLTARLVSVTETKGGSAAKTGEEGQVQSGTKGTTAAKDVGIGAGIGTVAGLIFGHAVRGLAIGAIAGGGYVLAEGGKDVNLPAHTGLVLQTEQSLSIPATSRR